MQFNPRRKYVQMVMSQMEAETNKDLFDRFRRYECRVRYDPDTGEDMYTFILPPVSPRMEYERLIARLGDLEPWAFEFLERVRFGEPVELRGIRAYQLIQLLYLKLIGEQVGILDPHDPDIEAMAEGVRIYYCHEQTRSKLPGTLYVDYPPRQGAILGRKGANINAMRSVLDPGLRCDLRLRTP